jgi:hypothetical protein
MSQGPRQETTHPVDSALINQLLGAAFQKLVPSLYFSNMPTFSDVLTPGNMIQNSARAEYREPPTAKLN